MSFLTRIFKRHLNHRYIVWRRFGNVSVKGALEPYADVLILRGDNPSEALVEMSDELRQKIAKEHPELSIEPNVLYELQA